MPLVLPRGAGCRAGKEQEFSSFPWPGRAAAEQAGSAAVSEGCGSWAGAQHPVLGPESLRGGLVPCPCCGTTALNLPVCTPEMAPLILPRQDLRWSRITGFHYSCAHKSFPYPLWGGLLPSPTQRPGSVCGGGDLPCSLAPTTLIPQRFPPFPGAVSALVLHRWASPSLSFLRWQHKLSRSRSSTGAIPPAVAHCSPTPRCLVATSSPLPGTDLMNPIRPGLLSQAGHALALHRSLGV